MMFSDPSSITLSRTVYALLLRAYPSAFQQRFRAETLQVFRDQCRSSYAVGGTLALLGLWLHALPDVLRCALGEHLAEWMSDHPAQRCSPRRQALLTVSLSLAVVAIFLMDQNTPPETPMAVMYACVLFAAGALLPPRLGALIGLATLGVYIVDGWVSPSGWTLYRWLGLVALLAAGLWALRTGADHARLRAQARLLRSAAHDSPAR
jgi:integral membrane sensor domain MASE1